MRRSLLVAAFAWCSTASVSPAQPLSSLDPVTERLLEAQRRGQLGDRLAPGGLTFDRIPDDGSLQRWSSRTAVPSALAATLVPQITWFGLETDPERQLRPAFADVRQGDAVDPWSRLRVNFAGRARLHERVSAGVDFAFDTHGDNDPRNRTRTFSQLDASNNFDAAWLRMHFDHGAIMLGRLPFQWGPERNGGLLISDLGPAPDVLHGRLDWGPHVLQSFAGQLSSEVVDDVSQRRWLYGHRADLYFLDDRLRVAISEVVLVAGAGEGLSLRYLNPIPMWTQVQVESDGDPGTQVNAIQAVDATWTQEVGSWRGRLYGSLAVDDVQIDPEGREDDPDQLAWTAGLDASHHAWLLGYEYRRIGTWTYLHRGQGTDHRNFGRPLGAPEGPDSDRHDLRVDWRADRAWAAFAGLQRWRRGENRMSTSENRLGRAGQPFPRGTVEKRWVATAGVTWERPGTAKAALQAAFHSIRNVNNESGVDEDVWEIRAVIDLFLPGLSYRVD